MSSHALAEEVEEMGMKILVLEDDPFTRSTLTGALEHEGVEVGLSTGSAREALEFAKKHAIDAALLDLDLGAGPTGIDVAHALRRHLPHLGLVLLSSFAD
ncbi:MAG: response regulator, partial [Actinobacteria bacterium]|nr:response regulator [Actinomycetota bacterium]